MTFITFIPDVGCITVWKLCNVITSMPLESSCAQSKIHMVALMFCDRLGVIMRGPPCMETPPQNFFVPLWEICGEHTLTSPCPNLPGATVPPTPRVTVGPPGGGGAYTTPELPIVV